jgi:hypothetical protein
VGGRFILMARIWKDRIVEKPRTFTIQNNSDGTVTLIPAPGAIIETGTPVNAAALNGIETDLANMTAKQKDIEILYWMGGV